MPIPGNPMIWIMLWLVFANLLGLILMGADKNRAKRGKWRVPEKTFFLLAVLGGSVGCWAGMYLSATKPDTGILWWHATDPDRTDFDLLLAENPVL